MTTKLPSTHDHVREYYGETLQGSIDLKTNACTCSAEPPARAVREALTRIHPEILERFYGCGSPIPPALEGCTVLDLGCGTGRDLYVAAQLVGESGRVIGVDMTESQLVVARRHEQGQAGVFGFTRPNTRFLHGKIEDLAALGVEDESVDVVISNCVINLSPRKDSVLSEIFRVLKPGGELYSTPFPPEKRSRSAATPHPCSPKLVISPISRYRATDPDQGGNDESAGILSRQQELRDDARPQWGETLLSLFQGGSQRGKAGGYQDPYGNSYGC